MSLGEAISSVIFMALGLFGISAQFEEINCFLLIGSIGIIMVVTTQIIKKSEYSEN